MINNWVTIEKAQELTGLPASFLHERTGLSGTWPECKVWKWFEGRKLIDMEALNALIAKTPSVPSNRGRRKAANDQCHEPQASQPA